MAMVAFWAEDGQTIRALDEKLLFESNTLTPILKRLETTGNIARSRDPADERQVRVRLTEVGTALRVRARGVPACILKGTGLSESALGRLQAEIAGVRENLLKAAGQM